MGKGIKNQIGPYMYAEGAIGEKAFSGRLFKIVIAGARNAGIIGPEDNGIAILDDDHNAVVLDNHVKESTGYFGPSANQLAEFQRIMGMDWKAFTDFVRNHPRYREGSVPDVNADKPLSVRPEPDRVIFPASQKDKDCPYDFPLESRWEIVQFLLEHKVHRLDGPYSKWAYAWDIKVHRFETDGHNLGYENDPAFDGRWESYLKENDIFWDEAGDAVRHYTEGEYTTYPGNDQGDYQFHTAGRSGGWLVLTGVKELGDKLAWEGQSDLKEWLKDLDDAAIVRLYKLIVQVDKDVSNPAAEMAHRYAFRRSELEAEWKAEPKAAVS